MTQSDHRSRFEVNAATLMISSAAASALGFVYWIVAARLFTTSSVGQASTVISAATMLGTVACMALGGSKWKPKWHPPRVIGGGGGGNGGGHQGGEGAGPGR